MPTGFAKGYSRGGGGGFEPISLIRRRANETDPPADLMPYWPEDQQIQEAKEDFQKEHETPLWARLLNMPSNILFREGIFRGAKQFAEGVTKDGFDLGDVASGIGGFFSGEWDAISHGFGLFPGMAETHFSDIRKAMGGQDVEQGWGNFAINFVGDVMLDPAMYLNPLGWMTKVPQSAKVLRAGLTLAEQVGQGIRGGIVFRIPILMDTGIDVMKNAGEALSKLPLPFFDSFKSMNVHFAKGMDELFGYLRVNPVTGPLLQRLGAIPLQDPKGNAVLKAARALSKDKADAYVSGLNQKLLELPESIKAMAAEGGDRAAFLTDLVESGLPNIDNAGLVTDRLKRLPDYLKTAEFRNAWKNNEEVRDLWMTAAKGEGVGLESEAIKAIRTLHKKYDYWLPPKWLEKAGLAARPGIDSELAQTGAEAIAKNLAGFPGGLSPMEIDRGITTTLAQGAGETGQAAFRAAQAEKRMARYRQVMDDVAAGKVKTEELNQWMTVHKWAMEEVAKVETGSGIINKTLEPYFPRIQNPAVKKLLDRQQAHGLSQIIWKDGAAPSWTKQRLLTGMPTTEAEALLMEIGTKATGFKGVKEHISVFQEELKTHGAFAVLKRIFPEEWVKKVLMPVDEELGSFFMANPIYADFWRIQQSAKQFQIKEYWKYVMDSPLNRGSARMADKVATMDLIKAAEGKWPLWVVSKNGALPRVGNIGEIASDAIGRDLRTRINVHEDRISKELNAQLADTSTNFDERLGHLLEVQRLGNKSDLTWNVKTPYAEAMMKKHIATKLQLSDELGYLRQDLADAKAAIRERKVELTRDVIDDIEAMERDIAGLQQLAADQSKKLYMLAENPPDWKIIDGWNEEVSRRVDAIRTAEEKIGRMKKARGAQFAKTGVIRTPKPEDEFYERLFDAQRMVVNKASELSHAHAQEMSLRAAVRSITDNMKTARAEVLAARKTGTEAEKAALELALTNARKISPEMMSNEAKLWYRFRDQGKLGWHELDAGTQEAMIKAGGDAKLIAMDPDTVQAAERLHQFMTAPDPLRNVPGVRLLDGFRSWFSTMTVIHPAMLRTRVTDVGSSMWTAAVSGHGVDEALFAHAQMSHGIGKAAAKGVPFDTFLSDTMTFTRPGDGAIVNAKEWMQAGQRTGGAGVGVIQDALLDHIGATAGLAPKGKGTAIMDHVLGFFGVTRPAGEGWKGAFGLFQPSRNPVMRIGRNNARWGDETVRSAVAMSAWKKTPGLSAEQAWQEAKQWTYGAGQDITSFERYVARRFLPFFGFQKWAMQRVSELWATKPSTLAWMSKARDNAYKATGLDPANLSTILPPFVNDNLGIPVANTEDGPKMYLFGSFFPVGSAIDMVNAAHGILTGSPLEGLRYIGQNLHPALKSAGEIVANRDFWVGREISMYPGQTDEMLGVEMPRPLRHILKSWFRGLAELDRLNIFNAAEMRVAMDAVRRGDVMGRRKELPLIERYLSSAFGVVPTKGYQIDAHEELRYVRRRDQEELGKKKALLRKAVEEGKETNADALREVIAEDLAEITARQAVEDAVHFNPLMSKKTRLVRGR